MTRTEESMPKPSLNNIRKAIHEAVNKNDLEAAEAILKAAEAGLLGRSLRSLTRGLLEIAIENDNEAMVILLLKHHADLKEQNSAGVRPVQKATGEKKWNIIKAILRFGDTSELEHHDLSEILYTAIEDHHIPKNDNIELITLLLRRNVKLQYKSSKYGAMSLIAQAAYIDKWDIVNLIATIKKADDDDKDQYGRALLYAVRARKHETVKKLFKANAKSLWRLAGYTPLHVAVFESDTEMIRLLIENGVNENLLDNDGYTAIGLADKLKRRDIFKFIFNELEKQYEKEIIRDISDLIRDNNKTISYINSSKFAKPKSASSRGSKIATDHRIIKNYGNMIYILKNILIAAQNRKINTGHMPEGGAVRLIYANLRQIIFELDTKKSQRYPSAETLEKIIALCDTNKSALTQTILTFFTQIQTVTNYIEKVRQFLVEMRNTIRNSVWTRKIFRKLVVKHTPKHVKAINKDLAQLDQINLPSEYFSLLNKVYMTLLSAFEKDSPNRLPATTQFYKSQLDKIKKFSMNATKFDVEETLEAYPLVQPIFVNPADSPQQIESKHADDSIVTVDTETPAFKMEVPSAPPLDPSTDLSQDPPPYDTFHHIIPAYLYNAVLQSAVRYSPQVTPLEPSAQPVIASTELLQSPPRYESLYPKIEGPERLPANLYPALERSLVQPSAQTLPRAQSPVTQQNAEPAAPWHAICPEYILPRLTDDAIVSQPEQSPAPITENLQQSTAKILQVIGVPANDAKVEHVPPSVSVVQAHDETEEERVSLAFKDLANAPAVPNVETSEPSQKAPSANVVSQPRIKVAGYAS